MQKTILIGGQAGQGVNQTSFIIAKSLTQMGYYSFIYRDYPSLIRGGHNFNVIAISDKPIYSYEEDYDVIIALDQNTIARHIKKLKKDGLVLAGKGIKSKNKLSFDLEKITSQAELPFIAGNDVLAGALLGILGLPIEPLLKTFDKTFQKDKVKIKKIVRIGYDFGKKNQKETISSFPVRAKPKYFLSGSQAVASGALASGIDMYIAYPMTPATPVLHLLAKQEKNKNISVLQLENEIAVINAALGASYAGAMAMVGTSGGGFALMGEAMSLQGMSEVPLVVYLAQRTSPSTGIPTYSTQGDLKFALNVGHGEFPRVVVAPGDAQEAFYRTIEAFYLAYKYRVLSIIISDKHLAESYYSFDGFEKPRVKASRFIINNPPKDYKSYKITRTGVSPRAVPGQGPFVRATSYEHDEYGYTKEDPEWAIKMNDKRLRKIDALKKEIAKLEPIKIYGKGKNLIIGWGSTKGAILDALASLKDFRYMQVSYIKPFPSQQVKKEIEKSRNIFLVENNATGLLGDVIAEQTGHIIKNRVLKYDARPFKPSDIIKKLKIRN